MGCRINVALLSYKPQKLILIKHKIHEKNNPHNNISYINIIIYFTNGTKQRN
jgi:hypothetical protein